MTGQATVWAPLAPHPSSLADPSLMIRDASGEWLVHYCPISRCAGLYDLRSGLWRLFCPIDAREFVELLEQMRVSIADTPDRRRWLTAISAAPVQMSSTAN